LVVTTDDLPESIADGWRDVSAEVVRVPAADGGVELKAALSELGRRGLCHVLCEGGPTLASSLVTAGLVDRFVFYLAPRLIGGDAPGLLTGGVKTLADSWSLRVERVRRVGPDLRIDARPDTERI
jgi:diaminohydroxyphosphoribosylaminopyrimidine deaminase/5-amino-6-(5-phosphoribosylamino)uracil reductase